MQVMQHDLRPTNGRALDAWEDVQSHLPEQCQAFPGGTGEEHSIAIAQAEPVLMKQPGMHALRKAPAAHNNAGTWVRAGFHLGQQSGLNFPEEDIIRLALAGLCILALLIV
jgi:hypothetical protein